MSPQPAGRPPAPPRRQTAGTASARPGPLDALHEAKRTFLAGRRVDMRCLARALGVDRATLYRWVGSRDRLLTEVLWNLLEHTIGRLRTSAPDGGRPIAADVLTDTTQAVIANQGMRRFLEREGDLALRLLTTNASEFQQRLTTLVADIVDTDRRHGHLHSTVPGDDLPYVLVRIVESYVYLSLITGEQPDAARASRVLHALLPQA